MAEALLGTKCSSSSSISHLSPNFHLFPTNIKRSQHLIHGNFSPNSRIRREAASLEGAKTAPAQIKKPKNRYEMVNLTTWLLQQEQAGNIDAELAIVLSSISLACKQIASLLQRSSIVNITGTQGTVNIQGEDQKKLDVISNELFCNCLRSSGRTGIIASEEEDVPVAVEETYSGNYIVVFDPIDGSANIDIALTTGSIFGIYGPDQQCLVDMDDDSTIDQAREKCIVSVCQPGSNLVAAGYCLYSSSVVYTLSVGNGVYAFTLDPAYGEFVLTHEDIKIPKAGRIYSFNEGNYDLWDEKLQSYLDHLKQPGPNGKPYSGRYIGCLVGEIHRMLLYGGIYGNPKNKSSKNGNLRLLYECAPMSYIIEQAGGKATDGNQRILEIMPEQIHQRTSEVSKLDVQSYITKKRSCLPKCALQQIKDTVDATNPLATSLETNNRSEVGSNSRDGDCLNAVDSNGINQSCEVGGDAQHVLSSGNATTCLGANTNGVQENQSRTLVPFKRTIDAFTAHEGEHSKTEHLSENSSGSCIRSSRRFKQEVISPRCDAVHDFESIQRDGVSTELSAQIPHAIIQKGNLENGALVGGLDGSCESAASKIVRQNIDASNHDDLLPEIMISGEKIQNVVSSSKACDELRTSSGSSPQVIHQDSCICGAKDHRKCIQGNLFKGVSGGAKRNIVGSDEPEFSSDSDGYQNEMTGLSAMRNDFLSSQCAQGQDPLTTENGRVLNLCVKCNEAGQLLICSSNTCPLVVHQSCLGSVPSYDNKGNFYCPFCAYSRAISECLEFKNMSWLARKDLASFVGRRSKKSSRNSCRTKKNLSREDEELCHDKNSKDVLNDVIEARSALVCTNSLNGKITEMPSPQPEASVTHEPVAAGPRSKISPTRLHKSKQKLSREEEKLCHNEDSKKKSLNQVQEPGNAPVSISSPNAEFTQIGSPQPDASAPPELVNGQSGFEEQCSEDEDTIASRYCVRFRNSDKNYFFKFAVPILQFLK